MISFKLKDETESKAQELLVVCQLMLGLRETNTKSAPSLGVPVTAGNKLNKLITDLQITFTSPFLFVFGDFNQL